MKFDISCKIYCKIRQTRYDVGMQCFGYTLVHLSLSGYFIEAQKNHFYGQGCDNHKG